MSYYSRKSTPFPFLGVVLACIVAVGIVVAIIGFTMDYNEEKTAVCTVSSKETISKVVDGNSKTEKRVFTEECGVFTVNDSLVKGKWRSADTYGSLKENHKYELTYNGWRNGFLSLFPNIISAKEV